MVDRALTANRSVPTTKILHREVKKLRPRGKKLRHTILAQPFTPLIPISSRGYESIIQRNRALSSGTDQVKMAYHLDGSLNTQTDQRGVVHTYQYDTNRRVELDRVTNFGSSGIVDQTVKSIGRSYDEYGRVDTITSYERQIKTRKLRANPKFSRADCPCYRSASPAP